MDGERKLPLSHVPKRSGSGNRRKQRIVNFRATAEEYALVEHAAESAGLSLGSYIRETILVTPQTRSRRRARADVAALAKLIAKLNRVGGNVNQIARAANYGEQLESAWLRDVLGLLLDTIKRVRAVMGFEA
jgi:uncharacterized protein (DUF1778 family)